MDTRKPSSRGKNTARGGQASQTKMMARQQPARKSAPKRKARHGLLGVFDRAYYALDRHVDHDGSKPDAIFTTRKRPPNFVASVAVTSLQLLIVVALVLGSVGAGALMGVARAYVNTAPDLSIAAITDVSLASQIYDAAGNAILTYSGTQNRLWATFEEMPENLIDAVISTEDARFYQHNGVDIKRIFGSFVGNFTSTTVQGASTITQQLIKSRMLTPERSYRRKIQEAYLAMQLENAYDKKQILEAYLNDLNLAQGNYGVKMAARDYFGKELSELTLRECAMLAGVANSPATYDPRRNYYTRNRPELTDNRTATVLSRMYREGCITYEEYTAALAEKTAVRKERTNTAMSVAPSFVDYLITDIIDHFITARGLPNTQENRNAIDYELKTSGYHIYTTLDTTVQTATETALYQFDGYPKTKNPSDATGSNELIQPQAAAVVIDWRTGQVKAMVGGRTPPEGLKVLNRAYMSHQPVGSSIKPLAVYGPAIDAAGLGAGTIIQNLVGTVDGWVGGTNSQPNTGGVEGPVSMRTAIVKSLNLSAARTLMEMSGPNSLSVSAGYLQRLGIDMKYVKQTGAGLALGVSGISPLEEAVAYAAIANKGQVITPISFTKVEDASHKLILNAVAMQQSTQVFKPSTAWLLVDMMTEAVQSGTGTPAKVAGVTVAGKTGTNDNYRGVTFAGVTPHYACAIYVGHDDYKPLQNGATGGKYAAPLFARIMKKTYADLQLKNAAIIAESPESLGLVKVRVCAVSGMLATEACDHDMGGRVPITDWFRFDVQPTEECTMHIPQGICTASGKLATLNCPEVTPKSYVLVPTTHVLARCNLKDFPWYHIGDTPLDPLTNADQFCSLHAGNTSARTQAMNNAHAALLNAQVQIGAHLNELTTDSVANYQTAYDALETLVNSPTAPLSMLTAATTTLNNLVATLKMQLTP